MLWKFELIIRDDEYVGEADYFEQPAGRTSVLSGFVYISKLFRSETILHRVGSFADS
jgi:hypothetical protein